MAESQIFLGTFCVQTDGDCIDDTAEILRCIALIDEVAETVGVYTDLDFGAELLCEAGGLQKIAEPFSGFAVTAEDQLIELIQVPFAQKFLDLIQCRLAPEPQRIGVAKSAHHVADAELTSAGALVSEIGIKPSAVFIKNVSDIFH